MARLSKSGNYVILDDACVIFDPDESIYITSNDPEFDGDGHKGMRVSVSKTSPGFLRLGKHFGLPKREPEVDSRQTDEDLLTALIDARLALEAVEHGEPSASMVNSALAGIERELANRSSEVR